MKLSIELDLIRTSEHPPTDTHWKIGFYEGREEFARCYHIESQWWNGTSGKPIEAPSHYAKAPWLVTEDWARNSMPTLNTSDRIIAALAIEKAIGAMDVGDPFLKRLQRIHKLIDPSKD